MLDHDASRASRAAGPAATAASTKWTGRYREYDLVKEFVIALVVVSLLTVALAAVFSSPDEKQVTLASWSRTAPNDFVATAATELDGTSGTASYGAPYTHTADAAQKLGPVSLQHIAGVTHPIDTANDFVVGPLDRRSGRPGTHGGAAPVACRDPCSAAGLGGGLRRRAAEGAGQRPRQGEPRIVRTGPRHARPTAAPWPSPAASTGPCSCSGQFFQTDYTQPLLFIADGAFLEAKADAQHLGGDQWGMMNETGSYPGQAWLWLYTFWYQVKPFSTSGNADALVMAVMAVLSLGLILIPFIPGVRSIPRWIPVHRLIWRSYYRDQQ